VVHNRRHQGFISRGPAFHVRVSSSVVLQTDACFCWVDSSTDWFCDFIPSRILSKYCIRIQFLIHRKETQCLSATKINQLVLFGEIMSFTARIIRNAYILCTDKMLSFYVKGSVTHNNYWPLRG
jgi:hypothetical protein